MAVAEQTRTRAWVDQAEQPETRRARERAIEQIAAAASVSHSEAVELAEGAAKRISGKLPPSDLRDLRAFRLLAESSDVLRGLSTGGSRVASRAKVELRRLTDDLADKIAPRGAPEHHAISITLRDQLLDPQE
jgi:hypothetical protein